MEDARCIRILKADPVGRALGITVEHDFEIAIQPVSVAEYEAFCAATGYRTSAERGRLKGPTYFDNSTLYELTGMDRANAPAVHVSFMDAMAYCAWAGRRLPTEEERVVAAMVTAKQARSYNSGVAFQRRYVSSDHVLRQTGLEITGTQPIPTTCVVRSGPYLILPPGETIWSPKFRVIVPIHQYLSLQFRVCKGGS